ncbi:MAG: DUF1499 domain-containing protein [Acidisphaera sp.]|nr:DUF1499 domain-containing protein [Acidisphaera sp.]
MRLFPALLGLVLAGCGSEGAEGLRVPPPTDFAQFTRSAAPHTALAAPAGTTSTPDFVAPVYPVPASRLYRAIRAAAAAQPRTYEQIAYHDRMQAHWVVRSAVLNFPDLVAAQVTPRGRQASTLTLFSTSLYGYYDFGVNRRRLRAWLAALDAALAQEPGS